MMIVLVIQIPVHQIPAIVDQLINAPKRKFVVTANAKVFNISYAKDILKRYFLDFSDCAPVH